MKYNHANRGTIHVTKQNKNKTGAEERLNITSGTYFNPCLKAVSDF